jgi:hypothetical protein
MVDTAGADVAVLCHERPGPTPTADAVPVVRRRPSPTIDNHEEHA